MLPAPNRDFPDKRPEQIMPWQPKLVCVSDPHFPYHNLPVLEKMIEIIWKRGIKTALHNGDMMNNGHVGHKGVINIREAGFEEGRRAFAQTLNAMTEAGITDHWLHPGNHDDKIWRKMFGEMSFPEFFNGFIRSMVSDKAEYHLGRRYYTIMRNPGGIDYRFTHQFGYSQLPTRVAARLCEKFRQHIVTGHQHHAAWAFAKDARCMLIDLPMCADQPLLEYTSDRDTPFPIHKSGFTVFHEGFPTFFLDTNSKAWWDRELRLYS